MTARTTETSPYAISQSIDCSSRSSPSSALEAYEQPSTTIWLVKGKLVALAFPTASTKCAPNVVLGLEISEMDADDDSSSARQPPRSCSFLPASASSYRRYLQLPRGFTMVLIPDFLHPLYDLTSSLLRPMRHCWSRRLRSSLRSLSLVLAVRYQDDDCDGDDLGEEEGGDVKRPAF